jgi:hypothetical protein
MVYQSTARAASPPAPSWQGHADVLFDADLEMAEHPGQLGILLRVERPVGRGAPLGECRNQRPGCGEPPQGEDGQRMKVGDVLVVGQDVDPGPGHSRGA